MSFPRAMAALVLVASLAMGAPARAQAPVLPNGGLAMPGAIPPSMPPAQPGVPVASGSALPGPGLPMPSSGIASGSGWATSSASASMEPVASASVPPREGQHVKIRADHIVSDRAAGVSTAFGNVRIEIQGVVITTDSISFNQKKRVVTTDAPFTLVQQDSNGKVQTITGVGLHYDMKNDEAVIHDAHLETPAKVPGQIIYITARELTSKAKQEFELKDGTFTTCDFIAKQETPHYHLESHAWIKFVPDQYAMGADVTVYLNNHPVFWLPFFYIPLQKQETQVQLGKNDVEGLFAKTSLAYRFTPHQYGTLYLSGLEFKAPGAIGFDHIWDNLPNSITGATVYGLLVPDQFDYVAGTDGSLAFSSSNPWIQHRLDPANPSYFQDHWYKLHHQQRLFDRMLIDGWWEDKNLYNLQRISPGLTREGMQANPSQSYRDDYTAWFLGLNDSRIGTTYGLNRNFREDRGLTPMRSQTDTGNLTGTYGGFSFNGATNRSEQTQFSPMSDGVDHVATVSSAPPSVTVGQTDNLTLNETLPSGLHLSSATSHTRNEYPSATNQPRQERLTETLDYTQGLGWADLHGVASRMFNLTTPPDASLATQKADIAKLGYLEKLPELTLSTHPLLEQFQPFTLNAVLGRYVEDQSYDPTVALNPEQHPVANLDPVNRFKLGADLTGKPLDLGMGASLNFGSSGYEQRFYSTGDAEYRLTGQAMLSNQFWKYVNTSLTYHQDITPEATASPSSLESFLGLNGHNMSPFKQFENMSLSRQHTMSAAANANYETAFNWTNTLSYNYEIQRFSPYNTGITVRPNARVNLTLNTGYNFPDKPYLEFGKGKWQDISSTVHLQSSDTGFGGVYGQDDLTPGWSMDSSLTYSVDTGEWRSLTNTLTLDLGTTWQGHWSIAAQGQYDVTLKHYDLLSVGLNKDLHDFIASFTYNKRLDAYTFSISMIAFQTNLVNWGNKNQGGIGDPSSLFNQIGTMAAGGM